MDELDLKIVEALGVLAALVNQSEGASKEEVPMSLVPTSLLWAAKQALDKFRDGEYGTEAIRSAIYRPLD